MLEGGSYTVEITYTVCCEIKAANVCSRPYTTIRNHNLILKAQVLGFSLDSCQTLSCCSVRKIQISQPLSPPPHLSNPTPPPLQPHPLHLSNLTPSTTPQCMLQISTSPSRKCNSCKNGSKREAKGTCMSHSHSYSKQQPGAI